MPREPAARRPRLHRFALAALGLLLSSCSPPDAASESRHADVASPKAAAVVEHRQAESGLATVTLTPEAEKRLGIRVAPLESKSLGRRRLLGGEVVAPPGASGVQAAPLAGTIAAPKEGQLPVPGGRVEAGDVICLLSPLLGIESQTRLAASRADAEGALGKAAVEVEAARVAQARAEQLLRDRAGTQRGVEEARARVLAAEAALKGARTALDVLTQALAGGGENVPPISVRAPVSGLLRTVQATPGQVVPAGAPLFEVVPADGLWIRVPVPASEAAAVDGQALALVGTLGVPNGRAASPVTGPPTADPAGFTVDRYYAAPPPEPGAEHVWRAGERVAVSLPLLETEPALVTAPGAILHDAHGGSWVYESLGTHRYARRRVTVLEMTPERAVLGTQMKPGTAIVVEGAVELFGTEFGAGK